MKLYKTQYCIKCKREPDLYTGHVLRGNEKITAGWCNICHDRHVNLFESVQNVDYSPGFSGYWIPNMGIIDWREEDMLEEVSLPEEMFHMEEI